MTHEIFKDRQAVGWWLRITQLKGFIEGGKLTIRRFDLDALGNDPSLNHAERKLMIDIAADECPLEGLEVVVV